MSNNVNSIASHNQLTSKESLMVGMGTDGTFNVLNLDSQGALLVNGSITPANYDKIELTYTGDNVTGVVYKLGAATLRTLVLAYSGTNVTSITIT